MRTLATTLIALLLLAPATADELVQRIARSAAFIHTDEGRGAGVQVRRTLDCAAVVLTARHVVEGCERAQVRLSPAGDLRPATVVACAADSDLALLVVPRSDACPVELAPELPEQGDPVWTVGAPRGQAFWASPGTVACAGLIVRGHLGIDAKAVPGMSGAGVWDARGRLVGLLSTGSLQDGMLLAVPVTSIRKFLREHGM